MCDRPKFEKDNVSLFNIKYKYRYRYQIRDLLLFSGGLFGTESVFYVHSSDCCLVYYDPTNQIVAYLIPDKLVCKIICCRSNHRRFVFFFPFNYLLEF